jgi:hypothetical protein
LWNECINNMPCCCACSAYMACVVVLNVCTYDGYLSVTYSKLPP